MTFTPAPEQYIPSVNLDPAPAVLFSADGTVFYDLDTLIQTGVMASVERISGLDTLDQNDQTVREAYIYELGIGEFLQMLQRDLDRFREGFEANMPVAQR